MHRSSILGHDGYRGLGYVRKALITFRVQLDLNAVGHFADADVLKVFFSHRLIRREIVGTKNSRHCQGIMRAELCSNYGFRRRADGAYMHDSESITADRYPLDVICLNFVPCHDVSQGVDLRVQQTTRSVWLDRGIHQRPLLAE